MYHYALLDKNNICVGESWLGEEVSIPDMVLTDEENVIGKKYNNGVWEEVTKEPTPPSPPPEPTLEEKTFLAVQETKTGVETVSMDNLITMDMALEINNKLDAVIAYLNITL